MATGTSNQAAGTSKHRKPTYTRSNPIRDWKLFVAGVRNRFQELLWSPRHINPVLHQRFLRICAKAQRARSVNDSRRGIMM